MFYYNFMWLMMADFDLRVVYAHMGMLEAAGKHFFADLSTRGM